MVLLLVIRHLREGYGAEHGRKKGRLLLGVKAFKHVFGENSFLSVFAADHVGLGGEGGDEAHAELDEQVFAGI